MLQFIEGCANRVSVDSKWSVEIVVESFKGEIRTYNKSSE
jgi:hypothetical protein